MKRAKCYVAGKLNDDAVHYIRNVHRMIKTSRMLRAAGFAVYVPANDLLEGIVDGNFDYEDYFENSQPWLAAADFVFLTPGWETSQGTEREIAYAKSLNIPVFDNINDLNNAFNQNQ